MGEKVSTQTFLGKDLCFIGEPCNFRMLVKKVFNFTTKSPLFLGKDDPLC